MDHRRTTSAPAEQIAGLITNTANLIWAYPTIAPLDNDTNMTAKFWVYNYGAPK